jgi:oligoribonuclease (3'-5' exoribonuclease)
MSTPYVATYFEFNKSRVSSIEEGKQASKPRVRVMRMGAGMKACQAAPTPLVTMNACISELQYYNTRASKP